MLTAMAVKEMVNRAYEMPLQEGLRFERRVFHSLFSTEDQKEGMAALVRNETAQFEINNKKSNNLLIDVLTRIRDTHKEQRIYEHKGL